MLHRGDECFLNEKGIAFVVVVVHPKNGREICACDL